VTEPAVSRQADGRPAEVLKVHHLSKVFYRDRDPAAPGVVALYDVSFAVAAGEFVSILGPSGCGKTTLIRTIAGLVPPDRGEIFVRGRRVTAPGPDRCVVFQEYGLLPWRRVLENVEFGLEIAGAPRDERRRRCARYLDLVGLAGFEHHYPHELSGGMRQRVGIARALTMEPDILLLDEPFGSVDAQTREQLEEELLRICVETRATAVFVTHSIDESIYLSDRVLVMQARPGRIREEVTIPLPSPRWRFDVRSDPRFAELRVRLRDLLRG
jgi:NitT/TauT family transport system ATP-binding protein